MDHIRRLAFAILVLHHVEATRYVGRHGSFIKAAR
jgi:hypothetical protein